MDFSWKSLFLTLVLSLALFACTRDEAVAEIRAGIGNACGPADGREVWLRTSNSNPTQCPWQASSTGLRIKINQSFSYGLDSLKVGTYEGEALDCRTVVSNCPSYSATLRIREIQGTTIRGDFQLRNAGGDKVGGTVPFNADVCSGTPLCG
jgi:hypothetical protein